MNTLPPQFAKVLTSQVWHHWSAAQQAYVLASEGEKTGQPRYQDKVWELDRTRPWLGESCPKCHFDYCFYAMPRNWSLRSSSDVWNLMKCANVACQEFFESCL